MRNSWRTAGLVLNVPRAAVARDGKASARRSSDHLDDDLADLIAVADLLVS
jgi:hypothetical protein